MAPRALKVRRRPGEYWVAVAIDEDLQARVGCRPRRPNASEGSGIDRLVDPEHGDRSTAELLLAE